MQYFLAYAVTGAVLPFISVYFRQRGLSRPQVGYVLGMAGAAVVLSPIIITLLADTRIDARRLMGGLFAVSGAGLLGTYLAGGFWMILGAWLLYSLAFVPIMPLQDGINLNLQQRRLSAGRLPIPYHHIRVWGTFGFIVPGVILFVVMHGINDVSACLLAAAACAGFGLINALLLPDPAIRNQPRPAEAIGDAARVPTLAAARALLKPHVLVFCVATFLLNVATAAYYSFYSVYLKEQLHLSSQWLGPVMIVGVVCEIAFMLGYGWIIRRYGVRGLMLIGSGSIVLRMGLLGLVPTLSVAVATQTLHGLMVLVLQVAPVVYLNQHAEDRYRHSMQGLYTMVGIGVARIVGSLLAGPVARWSLTGLFLASAGLSLVALALVAFAFREPRPAIEPEPELDEAVHALGE